MKISDIMTKKVVVVNPENNIIIIVKLLLKNKIHCIPVIDKKNNIKGIISEKDLFTKEPACDYLPIWSGLLEIGRYQNEISADQEVKMTRLIQVSAEEIMTADPVTIKEDADISELLKIFRETRYKTIPVVDENNKLSGVVSIVDVIRKVDFGG